MRFYILIHIEQRDDLCDHKCISGKLHVFQSVLWLSNVRIIPILVIPVQNILVVA